MRISLLIFYVFVLSSALFAQWLRTSGPEGISMTSLTNLNGTIYAGTATDGLYASTDDGKSWFPLNSGIENEDVSGVAALPGYLFAATKGKGVYHSTDGGQTWLPPSNGNDFYVLSIVTKDSFVFAGTGYQGISSGVYRSSDHGETWQSVIGFLYQDTPSMCVCGNKIIAGGFYNHYVSTDDGDSWSEINSLFGSDAYSIYADGDTILVGGSDEINRSTDQGNTFVSIPFILPWGFTHIYSITKIGSTYFAATYTDGVYKSTDNGTTWSPANIGMGPKDVRTIIATDASTLIAGTHYVGVYRSTDMGAKWRKSMSGFPAGSSIVILYSNGSDVYAGTRDGVYRSTNNGSKWEKLTGVIDTVNYSTVRGICEKDGSLYIGTQFHFNSTIYKSTDNGATWMRSADGIPPTVTFVTGLATSGDNIVAGTTDGAYYSSDDGNSWQPTNAPGCWGMAAPGGGYVFTYTLTSGIYRSADDGVTWTLVGPALNYTSIGAQDNFAYAGIFNARALVSNDYGNLWGFASGFPSGTSVFDIQPVGGNMVLAGTNVEANRIYASFDNGATFSPYSQELGPNASAETFAATDSFLFAGMAYNGVWRIPRPGIVVDVPAESNLPQTFHLSQNFPNPFNPTTTIQYTLPERARVSLKIYDVLGNEVKTLVDETQPPGVKSVVWDGKGNQGQTISSGIYFYKLQTIKSSFTKKMVLLQ